MLALPHTYGRVSGLPGSCAGTTESLTPGKTFTTIFKPSISQYLAMAGPQYRIVRLEHVGVGAQVLVGVAKGIFNGNSAGFPGTLLGMWPNGSGVTVSAGIPIDFNLGPGLAVRLTPDDIVTTFGSDYAGQESGIHHRYRLSLRTPLEQLSVLSCQRPALRFPFHATALRRVSNTNGAKRVCLDGKSYDLTLLSRCLAASRGYCGSVILTGSRISAISSSVSTFLARAMAMIDIPVETDSFTISAALA